MNNNIIYIIFILLSALKMKVYKPIHTHTRTFSLSLTHTQTHAHSHAHRLMQTYICFISMI